MQEASGLFFPDGRNRLGPITDFELDLRNYEEVTVNNVITVGQLYTDTKLALLRFYLTTQKKEKKFDSPHSHSTGLAPTLQRQESSQNQSSSFSFSVPTASPAAVEAVSAESNLSLCVIKKNNDKFDFLLYSTEGVSDNVFFRAATLFVFRRLF